MIDRPLQRAVSRAICRETCAFKGEPPCFEVHPPLDPKDNPDCDEPGCWALAAAALRAATIVQD